MKSKKSLAKIDSLILSEYILERSGSMSHLKLQKILFYIQALHLAYFETGIIDDDFEAWLHGPVSRKVYNKIKGISTLYTEISFSPNDNWGYQLLPSQIVAEELTSEQLDLINEIIDKYGELTSSQLENLSHSESPWINARKGYSPSDRCEVIIPKEDMLSYYKEKIYG